MPVLPLVGLMTVAPGFRAPSACGPDHGQADDPDALPLDSIFITDSRGILFLQPRLTVGSADLCQDIRC